MSALTQEERKDILKAVKPAFDTDESKSLVKFVEKILEKVSAASVSQAIMSVDGEIPVDKRQTIILTKATAGAFTLPVPTKNGIRLRIISTTDVAHTITTPSAIVISFPDLTTGNRITFSTGHEGVWTDLESYNGNWYLTSPTFIVAVSNA